MSDDHVLRLLLRRWWVLLLAGLAASGAAYATTADRPAEYESEARVLVGALNSGLDDIRASELLANTYAELAEGQVLLGGVVDDLGLETSAARLARRVDAVQEGTSRVISITVRAGSADEATTVAAAIVDRLQQLSPPPPAAADGVPVTTAGEISVVDPPTDADLVPAFTSLLVLFAFAAGTGVAGAGVLLAATIRGAAGGKETAIADQPIGGVPVLGELSFPALVRATEALTAGRVIEGDVAHVATKIALLVQSDRARTIAVVGASAEDGAGEVAAAVGLVASRTGRTTALVDADDTVRRISVAFGLSSHSGVHGPFRDLNGAPLPAMAMPIREKLVVVPAGARSPYLHGAASIDAHRMVDEARRAWDLTVVATPPLEASDDSMSWAAAADVTILVSRVGVPVDALEAHLRDLRQVGGRILGMVLTTDAPEAASTPAAQASTSRPPSDATPSGGNAPRHVST